MQLVRDEGIEMSFFPLSGHVSVDLLDLCKFPGDRTLPGEEASEQFCERRKAMNVAAPTTYTHQVPVAHSDFQEAGGLVDIGDTHLMEESGLHDTPNIPQLPHVTVANRVKWPSGTPSIRNHIPCSYPDNEYGILFLTINCDWNYYSPDPIH
ncbi:hypothetical protein BS47DRAFT_147839 [Hydnum rufescens UP504]|uniref:Uncharacterized protein n=1 Tax=Hydnum rufescens UP504 TaxID=1448309 RepID=A0A9P6DSF5_9AGAM|nr:hypothetical protein BS47DRAFT_147839 [Hydnum rufescens UP504]